MKIAVFGSTGRMGQEICEKSQLNGFETFCLNRSLSLTSLESTLRTADVSLDFSHHTYLDTVLKACLSSNTPLLTGVSTFEPSHMKALKEAGKKIPIMFAANTSIGMALMQQALKTLNLFKNLVEDVDVDIIDFHHHHKKDAPSGTAKNLLKSLGKKDFYNPLSQPGERPKDVVGLHCLRVSNLPGTHTISWCHEEESLELKHTCYSRTALAKGALKAALWLKDKPAGFYTMEDFIKDLI